MHLNGCIFYCVPTIDNVRLVWYNRCMDNEMMEIKELRGRIAEFFKTLAPDGARFTVEGYPAEFLIELTCDGEDRMMGYHCCLAPGHKGNRHTRGSVGA